MQQPFSHTPKQPDSPFWSKVIFFQSASVSSEQAEASRRDSCSLPTPEK